MASLKLIIVTAIFHFLSVNGALPGEPIGAVVFLSNGETNPLKAYRRDPHHDREYWLGGFGVLNTKGMKQLYDVGKGLRKNFSHLILRDTFHPDEIFVRSSDTDRTLMSAEAMLAGFYPVRESLRFESDIAWRPSPVEMVSIEKDYLIYMMQSCPKRAKLIAELLQTNKFLKFLKDNEWVRQHVEDWSGEKIHPIFFQQLSLMYDTLKIQELNNRTLPDWTKEVYPEKLMEIANFTYNIFTYNKDLARLTVGVALQTIAYNLIAIGNNQTTKKLFVYSGHDTTMTYLLRALNLQRKEIPPFGSSLRFELIQSSRELGLHAVYQGQRIRTPDCGYYCSLHDWLLKHQGLFTVNREKDCQLNPNEDEGFIDVMKDINSNITGYYLGP